MLQFIVPVAVLVLGGVSYEMSRRAELRRVSALTPARKVVYEAALQSVKDPIELRKLADVFDEVELTDEAEVLRKRAQLRELPAEIQDKRRDAFRKAMSCLDPVKVIECADAFSECACFSAASNLRKYASGLSSEDVDTIRSIVEDLESKCAKIPETGQVRSLATRQAVSNLRTRIDSLGQKTS
jgi:hypothetical protein